MKTEKNMTFKEIINDSVQFIRYEIGKTYFKPNEAYWIKLKIENRDDLSDLIVLLNTPISDIECYAFNSRNHLQHLNSGFYLPYQQQSIFTGDKNKLFLNYRIKNNIIYLKIKNILLFNYNLDNIEIQPVNTWILKKEKQHLFQGFFVGVIVVLVIISLLYKISSTRFINHYYIAYLLSNLILFLFLNEYTSEFLFASFPRIDMCLIVSMHFASLFYIQFARHFFQTEQISPIVDRIAKTYTRISIVLIFSFLVIAYFDFGIYSYLAIIPEIFNQAVGVLIMFFGYRKTSITGKLIIFGSLFSTISVVYMISNNHIVELTTRNLNLFQIGYLFEILFMIIAIKVRLSQIENLQKNVMIKNAILESENKIQVQENLLLKKENDIALLKTRLLKKEIVRKDKELAVNTMQLTQKDQLLLNLKERIKKILPASTKNRNELNEIIVNLNNHQKNTFWNEFEIYFEQMHNGFFTKLSAKYPSLSQGEKRLCALLKVGMTSKEIGVMTQKNFKSIEVLRSRLRKKLEIEPSENLTDFFNQI
ncbi:MAG: 7TM diverse intracellular signaling domain-containing protein [Bacteroidales bacterium]